MCDYSLQGVASRPAAVGDKLSTRNFGTGTRGFSASEDRNTAACLLPGTEIAFTGEVAIESPRGHHDAFASPDGQIVLLTALREGQEAPVVQLPALLTTLREPEEQRRAA